MIAVYFFLLDRFRGCQQESVGGRFDHTLFVQQILGPAQLAETGFHGESRKFPFDNPGKPYQRAHIVKADFGERFPGLQNFKSSLRK